MSWDSDFIDPDYATTVAATAYAIHSLKESKPKDQNGPDKLWNKMTSKAEDSGILPESVVKFSGKSVEGPDIEEPLGPPMSKRRAKEAAANGVEASKANENQNETTRGPDKVLSKKKSRGEDNRIRPEGALNSSDKTSKGKFKSPHTDEPMHHEKAVSRGSSAKKPSFDDSDDANSNKFDNQAPDRVPSGSTAQPLEPRKHDSARKRGPGDSMADAWEKEKMASIKERYERLRETIVTWEIKKKKKADSKLQRMEGKPNERKAKAVRRHREEISRIEEIATGARAQAAENRRKEEFKAREKANKIRVTGKLPATCLCF